MPRQPRYELGEISQLMALDYGYILNRIMLEPDTDPDQDPRPMAYFKEIVTVAAIILTAERLGLEHGYSNNHNHYVFLYQECETFEEFETFMTDLQM
jgi:hypothetical protein